MSHLSSSDVEDKVAAMERHLSIVPVATPLNQSANHRPPSPHVSQSAHDSQMHSQRSFNQSDAATNTDFSLDDDYERSLMTSRPSDNTARASDRSKRSRDASGRSLDNSHSTARLYDSTSRSLDISAPRDHSTRSLDASAPRDHSTRSLDASAPRDHSTRSLDATAPRDHSTRSLDNTAPLGRDVSRSSEKYPIRNISPRRVNISNHVSRNHAKDQTDSQRPSRDMTSGYRSASYLSADTDISGHHGNDISPGNHGNSSSQRPRNLARYKYTSLRQSNVGDVTETPIVNGVVECVASS